MGTGRFIQHRQLDTIGNYHRPGFAFALESRKLTVQMVEDISAHCIDQRQPAKYPAKQKLFHTAQPASNIMLFDNSMDSQNMRHANEKIGPIDSDRGYEPLTEDDIKATLS